MAGCHSGTTRNNAEVTKEIQKTVARTQQTAAKKKSAKKKSRSESDVGIETEKLFWGERLSTSRQSNSDSAQTGTREL